MALPPTRSAEPPPTHVLVYDATCPFCTAVAHWLERHARRPLQTVPFQQVDTRRMLNQLPPRDLGATAHFVTPDGTEYHGGEAMTRSFRLLPFGVAAAVLDLPLLAHLRDAGYALIARARPLLSRFIHP